MSSEMARLIVSLEARTVAFQKALDRANGVANRRAKAIESRFAAMNKRVSATFAGLGRGAIGVFAGAASLRGAQQLIDASTRIDNALKVAGLSGEELSKVYNRLFDSAQRNAAPLESLVTLYGRAAIVQKELGVSTEELLGFTNNVAVALRVAGTDAQTASGALLQLSQALGSGVVRAEEFNSILEGALPIAQAAAAGLKEAGGSVAELRKLVVDGKISSEAFFRAFEAGSVILEEKVAGSELTVSQAFVRLQNVLIDTAGELNKGSRASEKLAEMLDKLGNAIRNADFAPDITEFLTFVEQIGWAVEKLGELKDAIYGVSGAIARWTGGAEVGKLLERESGGFFRTPGGGQPAMPAKPKTFEDVRNDALGLGGKGDRLTAGDAASRRVADAFSTKVRPVSIDDYAKPASTGSGSGRGSGPRENPFERETRQIRERTVALQAETAAMAGLNPLVDDYGFALEKASATQELLNAAERAGLEITPDLEAQIAKLATSYANASVEAEKLAESQDQIRQTADDMRALGKDVLSGFISDLRQGTSAAEALQNALGKIADKLLDMALTSLFDPKGGGGIGGLFKLFGFADGGYTGPGGKHEVAGAVHKGEVVWSQDDVRRAGGVGAVEAMRKGMAAGPAINVPKIAPSASSGRQAVHVTVGVDVDSSGNLMPFVASVSEQTTKAGIRQYDRGSEGRLRRDSKISPRRGRI